VYYRKINTRIWNDEKLRALDFFAQDLWFYILTNDQTNQVGIYVWRHEHAQADLIPRWRAFAEQLVEMAASLNLEMRGLTLELLVGQDDANLRRAYHRAWQALVQAEMIHYHEPTRVLFVAKFLKYEPPASHLNVAGWKQILNDLPQGHGFFPLLRDSLRKFIDPKKLKKCIEALDKGLGKGSGKGYPKGYPKGRGASGAVAVTDIKNPDVQEGVNSKKKKTPHPGLAHLAVLQELSDHHAALFGRNPVKVQLNDHIRRIVKVLLNPEYGPEGCKLIQIGHKEITVKTRFMGWEFAYPMLRDGKKKFITEPDWSWIQTHYTAGKKKNRPEDEDFVS